MGVLFGLVALGIVGLFALICYGAFHMHQQSKVDSLEAFGVKTTYPNNTLPKAKIDAYCDCKEQLRVEYASASVEDAIWMCKLPAQAKDTLKYKLMQRAISDVQALQKIDADARGYSRLFSKGMISRKFWDSVVEAEQGLSLELEAVKLEAACVEPEQAQRRCIIQEAMQFVMRYGAAPYGADIPNSAGAINDIMKHFPPGGMPPGAMPPGTMLPPGAMPPGAMLPPGAMPPGMPRGVGGPPMGPPPVQAAPQDEAAGDSYNWRQDTDEVEVSVAVPSSATKGEVKVTFQPRSLRVEHCGAVLVEGTLASLCQTDGCTWTLSKGKITASLEKKDPRPWPSLFAKV